MNEPSGVTMASLAPEFSLPAGNGNEIRLTDFRSQKNVVLFFIREFN